MARDRPRSPAPPDLEAARQARVILSRAEREVREAAARARPLVAAPLDDARAFDALAGARLGRSVALALYRDGKTVAWAGDASPLGRETPGAGLRIVGRGARPALALVERAGAHGVLVAEVSLTDLLEPVGPGTRIVPEGLPDTSAGAESIALTAADGTPVGRLASDGGWPAPARREAAAIDATARAVLALLCLVLAFSAPLGRSGPAALTGRTALVLAARLALPTAALHRPGGVFDPASLAVVSPLGLLSSPGDVLATGVACAIAAAFAVAAPAPSGSSRIGSSAAARLALVVVSLGWAELLGALGGLVRRLVRNATFDLADFGFPPFEPPRHAAVVGLVALLIALVALATRLAAALLARSGMHAAIAFLLWTAVGTAVALRLPSPAGAPFHPAVLAALHLMPLAAARASAGPLGPRGTLALVAVVSALGLAHVSDREAGRALRSFVEGDLAASLEREEETARLLLEQSLEDLAATPLPAAPSGSADEAAWTAWRSTPLSRERILSAAEVRLSDGRTGIFSYHLPLPEDRRAVRPGASLLHQDVLHGGRRIRVLAGARTTPDGSTVTLRVALDPRATPFFRDPRRAREGGGGASRALLARRARAALLVSDASGALVHATDAIGIRVGREIVIAAQRADRPFWWEAESDGVRFDALTFEAAPHVLTIALARPRVRTTVVGMVFAALVGGLAGGAFLLAMALASGARAPLRSALDSMRASLFRQILAGFVVALTVPAGVFALVQARMLDTIFREELRAQAIRGLETARVRLAEAEGTSPDPRLDDAALIRLAEGVGHDLALWTEDGVAATSARELFREGTLPERPSARAWRATMLEGAALHVSSGGDAATRGVRVSTSAGRGRMLGLWALAHESAHREEVAERSRGLLVATLALVLAAALLARLVARLTTAPILDLARAATRVGGGDLDVTLASSRRDEIRTLVDAFDQMTGRLREQRAELSARAAFLARLLENATTGVVSLDASGAVTTANRAARELLGVPLAIGDPLDADALGPGLEPLGVLTSARPGIERDEAEVAVGPAGRRRTLRAVAVPLPGVEGEPSGRLLLLEDVSDLVKSKKLEAWAEMARRVAHEIKNPLTPIQFAAEHVLRVQRDRHPDLERILSTCMSSILKQVEVLRRIARDFSAYATGPSPIVLEPTPLGTWIAAELAPYLAAAPPGIRLELDIAPDIGEHPIDPSRLRVALVNLVENALQAMPEGGKVVVRARRARPDGFTLEVEDSGPGIPADVLPRIFEPYFSTRHGGTGLGLANARRAVEDHGGTLTVSRAAGRGSVFRVAVGSPGVR